MQVLEKHPQFGPALMQGELRPYRPMAAHFIHDEQHEEGGSHVVGPDLTPSKW